MTRTLIPFFNDLEEVKDLFHIDRFQGFQKNSGLSVYEDNSYVYVEAHVPGMESENIHVNLEEGALWIQAEKKEEKKQVKMHTQASTSFSYRINLPSQIDESKKIDAQLENGVLKVTFEKSQKGKTQRIEVKKK